MLGPLPRGENAGEPSTGLGTLSPSSSLLWQLAKDPGRADRGLLLVQAPSGVRGGEADCSLIL